MKSNINGAKEEKLWFLHSAAGACSGALTRLISQPFDVIKIRFQVIQVVFKCNLIYKEIYLLFLFVIWVCVSQLLSIHCHIFVELS